MTLNAIFQSRGFDAAQISHIQVEGVYKESTQNSLGGTEAREMAA
jgi:hypothetical protein